METSQLLSIESFSFKWVINLKLEGYLDESFRASLEAADEMRIPFIEMDPKKAVSRSSSFSMKDFNFSTSQQSQPPSILVHADEVFSNGLLMPFFLNPSKEANLDASNSSQKQVTTSSSESSKYVFSTNNQNHGWFFRIFLKSWRRIVKKHLHKSWGRSTSVKKHLGWLKRAYSHSNSSTRAETIGSCMVDSVCIDNKEWEETTSARTSTAYLIHDYYDNEKSIQDAVLHCKRSYGSL